MKIKSVLICVLVSCFFQLNANVQIINDPGRYASIGQAFGSGLAEGLDELAQRKMKNLERQKDLEVQQQLIELAHQRKLEEINHAYLLEQDLKQKQYDLYAMDNVRKEYPDFDEIVSCENVEMLKECNPKLANALSNITDLYIKAVIAYETIKNIKQYENSTEEYAKTLVRYEAQYNSECEESKAKNIIIYCLLGLILCMTCSAFFISKRSV